MSPISTVEMHTGGEPVRIITDGFPAPTGRTILDKRRDAMANSDDLRRLLMHEPRGHYDMYGVLPVPPDHPEADLAVLFMHNEGWSTMCGHATIALGRYAVDTGVVEVEEPETVVKIQVPAGLVTVTVEVADGRTGACRYASTPSFLAIEQLAVEPDGLPALSVDVSYGGAFYALVSAAELGWQPQQQPVEVLRRTGTAITAAVNRAATLQHPESPDLGFLYGTILVDDFDADPSTNVCIFADAQVDRSPTGSGVQARLAQLFARGAVAVGETRAFRSIVGSEFTGTVLAATAVGDKDAVIVEVGGRAFYTGESRFTLEEGDGLDAFVVS